MPLDYEPIREMLQTQSDEEMARDGQISPDTVANLVLLDVAQSLRSIAEQMPKLLDAVQNL